MNLGLAYQISPARPIPSGADPPFCWVGQVF